MNFDMSDVVDAEFEEIVPEKKVFTVDVGDIPESKQETYTDNLKTLVENKTDASVEEISPEQQQFINAYKEAMLKQMSIKPNRKQRRDMAKKQSDNRVRNKKR